MARLLPSSPREHFAAATDTRFTHGDGVTAPQLQSWLDEGLKVTATVRDDSLIEALLKSQAARKSKDKKEETAEVYAARILPLLDLLESRGPVNWNQSLPTMSGAFTPELLDRLFKAGMPTQDSYLQLHQAAPVPVGAQSSALADVIHAAGVPFVSEEWVALATMGNAQHLLLWATYRHLPLQSALFPQASADQEDLAFKSFSGLFTLASTDAPGNVDLMDRLWATDHKVTVSQVLQATKDASWQFNPNLWAVVKKHMVRDDPKAESDFLLGVLNHHGKSSKAQLLWADGFRPFFPELSEKFTMKGAVDLLSEFASHVYESNAVSGEELPASDQKLSGELDVWLARQVPREVQINYHASVSQSRFRGDSLSIRAKAVALFVLSTLLEAEDAQSKQGEEPLLWAVVRNQIKGMAMDENYQHQQRGAPELLQPTAIFARRVKELAQSEGASRDIHGKTLIDVLEDRGVTALTKHMNLPPRSSSPPASDDHRARFLEQAAALYDQAVGVSQSGPPKTGMSGHQSMEIAHRRGIHPAHPFIALDDQVMRKLEILGFGALSLQQNQPINWDHLLQAPSLHPRHAMQRVKNTIQDTPLWQAAPAPEPAPTSTTPTRSRRSPH